MNDLIAWFGTPFGLLILGGIIYLLIKWKREQEEHEEQEAKEEEEKRQIKTRKRKEKTMIITETKITKIKNLNIEDYEKMNSKSRNCDATDNIK